MNQVNIDELKRLDREATQGLSVITEDPYRATGRTTRIVQRAIECAKQGRTAWVVFHDRGMFGLFRTPETVAAGVVFKQVEDFPNEDGDWRIHTDDPNVSIFVDHYVPLWISEQRKIEREASMSRRQTIYFPLSKSSW